MEGEITLEILNAEGKKIEFYQGKQPGDVSGGLKTYKQMVSGIIRTHPDRDLIQKGISIFIRDEEGHVLHEYAGRFQ